MKHTDSNSLSPLPSPPSLPSSPPLSPSPSLSLHLIYISPTSYIPIPFISLSLCNSRPPMHHHHHHKQKQNFREERKRKNGGKLKISSYKQRNASGYKKEFTRSKHEDNQLGESCTLGKKQCCWQLEQGLAEGGTLELTVNAGRLTMGCL